MKEYCCGHAEPPRCDTPEDCERFPAPFCPVHGLTVKRIIEQGTRAGLIPVYENGLFSGFNVPDGHDPKPSPDTRHSIAGFNKVIEAFKKPSPERRESMEERFKLNGEEINIDFLCQNPEELKHFLIERTLRERERTLALIERVRERLQEIAYGEVDGVRVVNSGEESALAAFDQTIEDWKKDNLE